VKADTEGLGMTEAEWLARGDPGERLDRLSAFASERKLRLFLCGIFQTCRSPAHRRCEITEAVIEYGELMADGQTNSENIAKARETAGKLTGYR
jgi:hypothetical protein